VITIVVDPDSCEACEECVDICPAEVYVIEEGVSTPINVEECTECCSCVEVCPADAIEHSTC
jgi:NAD-dependent dihydropyrimidine dehydrogenase PreA subunit